MIHRPAEQVPPTVPAAVQYHEAADRVEAVGTLTTPWWQAFGDTRLDGLIEEALTHNLELAQLTERIEQANALVRQAGGRLFPQVDGNGRYQSEWVHRDDTDATRHDAFASLGASLSWELDVWGRLRSARRARELESQAAVSDWQGGRLLLSAAIAETYFEVLEQRQQWRLISEQIGVSQTLLDLTKLRFGQGQSSIVDVLQQREQLAATAARVPDVEARLARLEYTLDVLLGRAPGSRPRLSDHNLEPPPPWPETGVPSGLLESRPDLLAIRHRVNAVDYRVGEAVADRWPRFVIGGSFTGAGDPGINTLISSAFASLAGPIFDAGVRKAEVDLRRSQLREALTDYSQTYLTAVREVETALVLGQKQAEHVALLESQLQTAQQLLAETRNRYSQGLTDYLPVLAAVVTVQNLQRELLTSRRELLSARVVLHRALGGPMDPEGDRVAANAMP